MSGGKLPADVLQLEQLQPTHLAQPHATCPYPPRGKHKAAERSLKLQTSTGLEEGDAVARIGRHQKRTWSKHTVDRHSQ